MAPSPAAWIRIKPQRDRRTAYYVVKRIISVDFRLRTTPSLIRWEVQVVSRPRRGACGSGSGRGCGAPSEAAMAFDDLVDVLGTAVVRAVGGAAVAWSVRVARR